MTGADIIFALKRLRSTRAYVAGIVTMLVIGISFATTMFALSDPFLNRPLPFADPDRLVLIDVDTMQARRDPAGQPPDYPRFAEWQARTDLFDGLAAVNRHEPLRVRLPARVVALEAIAVSPNVFEVLGLHLPGGSRRIPDNDVWLTRHAASGPLAGAELRDVMLPLQPAGAVHVRGVLPASFLVPQASERAPADVLIEIAPNRIATTDRGITTRLTLVARLRQGIDAAHVRAALSTDAARRRFGVIVTPLATAMKASQRALATGALLSGLLVLVVCAANTLGMALTRGLYRSHQIATMEALGAGRGNIARLLLAEGACVTAASVIGALGLVPGLCGAIVAIVPRNFVVLGAPGVSIRVAAFAISCGVLVCAAWWIGSWLAWSRESRRGRHVAILRDRPLLRAVRFGLSSGQVAVTLVLVAGAVLLARSLLNLTSVDTGMTGDSMAVSVSYGPEVSGARLREIIERTTTELRQGAAAPHAAAVVGEMADAFNVSGTVVVGRPLPVELLWVSAEYFSASGMSFVRGRSLAAADRGGRGVVVNEALVNRYLGGQADIGQPLLAGGVPTPIVGVVRDSRRRALDEAPRPAIFRALDDAMPGMRVTYVLRGPDVVPARLEAAIRRVSPDAVILDGSTLRTRLAHTIQDRRFAMLVVALFATATIAVTISAIVGAVAFAVARRTREIAIRLALGATPRGVSWLTMRDTMVAASVGIGIGITVVVWLAKAVTGLFYDVSATDAPTLAVTAASVIILASGVAAVTARRAARLSPTLALRQE